MANLTSLKRKQIEDYYSVGISIEEIAAKTGVTTEKIKSITSKLPPPRQKLADVMKSTGLIADGEKPLDMSLLDMTDGILPQALWILNRTLQKHKETDELPSLRDTTGLVKAMMEIRGKITGETTGDTLDQNSIRTKTLADLRRILPNIPQNLKTLTGYSEVIELEKYEVKQIE